MSSVTRSAKRRKISTEDPQENTSPSFLQTLKAAVNILSPRSTLSHPLRTYGSSRKRQVINGEALSFSPDVDTENNAPQSQRPVSAHLSESEQEEIIEEGVVALGLKGGFSRRSQPSRFVEKIGEGSTNAIDNTPTKRKRRGIVSNGGKEGSQEDIISPRVDGGKKRAGPVIQHKAKQGMDPVEEAYDSIVVTESLHDPLEQPEIDVPVRSVGRPRRSKAKTVEAEAATSAPTKFPGRKRGRPPKSSTCQLRANEPEVHLHFKDVIRKPRPEATPRNVVPSPITPLPEVSKSADSTTPRSKRGRPTARKVPSVVDSPLISLDDTSKTSEHLRLLKSVLQDVDAAKAFSVLKSRAIERLTGKHRLPLYGLDEEYQKVHQLIQQTVVAGEGNSMLVIGARGTAKTTLVETVISRLIEDHHEDFYVVRLNGFIHTDDKLALREIWRQLGKEMEVDEDAIGLRSNYADTLTSILALLSHPTEHSTATTDPAQTSKSVVFVMDEFDLFASHSRQTLLYNLIDIAQSRKAPIAVLGLTTKVNIVESLEKRVKSRFSHRYVFLPLPKTFATFQAICKSALLCEDIETASVVINQAAAQLQDDDANFERVRVAWSRYMTSILTEDPAVLYFLRRTYAQTKSVPDFMAACLMPIVSMTPTDIPSPADFTSNTLLPPDSKLHILPGLSEIELALLIAAARLDIILDTDTCNFNMAYDEYLNLASRAKLLSSASGATALGGAARVWGREVALAAWERLEALELLVPALGTGGAGGMADVGRAGKLWKVDVDLEEIGGSRLDMSSIMARWCKEI